MSEMIPGP